MGSESVLRLVSGSASLSTSCSKIDTGYLELERERTGAFLDYVT